MTATASASAGTGAAAHRPHPTVAAEAGTATTTTTTMRRSRRRRRRWTKRRSYAWRSKRRKPRNATPRTSSISSTSDGQPRRPRCSSARGNASRTSPAAHSTRCSPRWRRRRSADEPRPSTPWVNSRNEKTRGVSSAGTARTGTIGTTTAGERTANSAAWAASTGTARTRAWMPARTRTSAGCVTNRTRASWRRWRGRLLNTRSYLGANTTKRMRTNTTWTFTGRARWATAGTRWRRWRRRRGSGRWDLT
mmetsp:Transcript_5589/g.15018  ORF Transcript_5589/g.15018 Transcript_5589/m.15018 type:complete len:250 (-) Transcript_5589:63-812(-)